MYPEVDFMEGAEVMTDNQWNGMIKMVMLIVGRCETASEALDALKILLRDDDASAVLAELEKLKKSRG